MIRLIRHIYYNESCIVTKERTPGPAEFGLTQASCDFCRPYSLPAPRTPTITSLAISKFQAFGVAVINNNTDH
jgi:hypothetical protein